MGRINRNDRHMEIKLCFDKMIKGKPYPNLATHQSVPYTQEWRKFSVTSPFSEPPMLVEFMDYSKVPYKIVPLEEADNSTFYLIALSFFDFKVNWFSLMSNKLLAKLKTKKIKILFYYWEADNPHIINDHISHQCRLNHIPRQQVKFISANSQAKNIKHFYHFVDDELLFQFRNRKIEPAQFHEMYRSMKFTALVRTHKYWRANVMTKIWEHGQNQQGYFSYSDEITAEETEDDNPIEVDSFGNLRELTRLFLNECPFKADNLSNDIHNDHRLAVNEHFSDSYLNVILESHMDVDQSNGILLSEKTFKPIKNAQPFIIFGAQGSLQLLRDMGYKTFEHVIDQSYDSIGNTSKRWEYTMNVLSSLILLSRHELHEIYVSLEEDIKHNQQLFLENKKDRLKRLVTKLYS